jgi:pyruvate dehydrogenase E1 component beta subunit
MVSKALDAAAALEKKGISAEVIDLRTVSPLDEETILASVEKTGKLLVVQETYRHCSVATDVSALVAEKGFDFLDAPIRLITAKDVPIPFAPVLENYVLPQTETVVSEAEKLLKAARGG